MVKTIEWAGTKVRMIDQSRLPLETVYIDCADFREVAGCIRDLKIRGAPAIGIAAAMGIAQGAASIDAVRYGDFMQKLGTVFNTLLETRPTAVNIRWAVERMKALLESRKEEPVNTLKTLLKEEAQRVLEEDIEINRAIGRWGAAFIKDGDNILTHCNAGSLATGGYGTATGPMRTAWEEGKKIRVYADETRPVLQGARLTAWELMQDGIPVTLITDSSAGALMKRGGIDLAIVGTDRTARNGDVANKIGTYSVAVLCKRHGIPLYVAAPLSSIDFTMASGEEIPIEERDPDEVTSFGPCRVAPEGVDVLNMAFDVTPAELVTAIITEKGAVRPQDLHKLEDPDVDIENLRIK